MCRAEGNKGGGVIHWDKCNSIINKILKRSYFESGRKPLEGFKKRSDRI